MLRLISASLTALIAITLVGATPPDDTLFKQLAVQRAMSVARARLSEMKANLAVEVLEENLPKVEGSPQYLVLLREAYRAHIRDLYLAGRPDLARRYWERLCILDPSALNDVALRPQADAPPRKFAQEPAKKWPTFPDFKGFSLPNPFAKKQETKPKSVARAQIGEASIDDPFDRKNQRTMPLERADASAAKGSVARGIKKFQLKEYAQAKQCFEEAFRADPTSLNASRDMWAYCIIDGVSKAMEQPGVLPAQLPTLQKQVEGAIEMAPAKVLATGQSLLKELKTRANAAPRPPLVTGNLAKVRRLGRNKEGWQVVETTHFRIFHKNSDEFAERVGEIAESTRLAMFRKWFGIDGVDWQPTCELILHPDVNAYTQMTGAPRNTPGHSRMEVDNGTKRIIARRMDLRCDVPNMLQTVLPHEATHVVLAGMFGPFDLPRWADEGIAVLAEPDEKIEQHRRNLHKHHQDGLLFGLKELMKMENYPAPRRIGAFYAQSVVLVEFLTQQRGPRVFAEFVKDGLRQGYEKSLERHYKMSFAQLDQLWQRQVINNSERVAARR
ncbi:MAG: hypothetical protein HYX68_11615 [Planctomycetes bacterium]|nr:hypothetical protein [Planctomycetota bacterium]